MKAPTGWRGESIRHRNARINGSAGGNYATNPSEKVGFIQRIKNWEDEREARATKKEADKIAGIKAERERIQEKNERDRLKYEGRKRVDRIYKEEQEALAEAKKKQTRIRKQHTAEQIEKVKQFFGQGKNDNKTVYQPMSKTHKITKHHKTHKNHKITKHNHRRHKKRQKEETIFGGLFK